MRAAVIFALELSDAVEAAVVIALERENSVGAALFSIGLLPCSSHTPNVIHDGVFDNLCRFIAPFVDSTDVSAAVKDVFLFRCCSTIVELFEPWAGMYEA